MFDKYSLEVSKVFKMAEKEMLDLKQAYVGTEHLLLAILKSDSNIAKISKKYGLEYETFKVALSNIIVDDKNNDLVLYTPLLKRVINSAIEEATGDKKDLNNNYLFRAIFEEGEGIAIRILLELGVDIDKLYASTKEKDKNGSKKNLEILNIGKVLAEEVDFNDKVIGREEELELTIETLVRKNKNNPLLVGDAGVGKTAIIEELTRRIEREEVPNILKGKKIVALELGALVAGTKYRGEFEEKLIKIIKELENNPDIIVFIDEIHTIVNAGGAEGAINASDILKPYLARGKIKVIGATTIAEYNKSILKDKALSRRFEIIKVVEPNTEETITILNKVKKNYEKHYGLKITSTNIRDIVELTNKYVVDKRNPDKSLDVLDSVCAMVSVKSNYSRDGVLIQKQIMELEKKKQVIIRENLFSKAVNIQEKIMDLKKKKCSKKINKVITKEDILKLLGKKCNIPLLEDKNESLRKVKLELSNNIIGQDEAIDKILLNMLSFFDSGEKPMCLMLTGSTGVGKTETVKQISKALNINLIRLDMSEYNLDISVNRLIGASAGYVGYNDEAILNQIRMHPYSIILVDELEKASVAVMNLFLQIMDEGIVTNAQGEKLDFKNTMIFMTSNVKGTKKIGFQDDSLDYSESFSKEFLARFDDIVSFNDIDDAMVMTYLKKNNVKDLSIIDKINYKKYGLREVKKIIRKSRSYLTN